MNYSPAVATADGAWNAINGSWFAHAKAIGNVGTATSRSEFYQARTYTRPGKKLSMGTCKLYFLLEGLTPWNGADASDLLYHGM
jgi:hypothetical protein